MVVVKNTYVNYERATYLRYGSEHDEVDFDFAFPFPPVMDKNAICTPFYNQGFYGLCRIINLGRTQQIPWYRYIRYLSKQVSQTSRSQKIEMSLSTPLLHKRATSKVRYLPPAVIVGRYVQHHDGFLNFKI